MTVSGVAGRGAGFRGVDLGFPSCDGALFGARVRKELDAVAGDAEVGVLDVGGDDPSGVGGADAQPLPVTMDDVIAGNLALHADWPGSRRRQRGCGDPRAAELGAVSGRDGLGPVCAALAALPWSQIRRGH